MQVELEHEEFVTIANHMDILNYIAGESEQPYGKRREAVCEWVGMAYVLDALGFEVTCDERGDVIDIAQH